MNEISGFIPSANALNANVQIPKFKQSPNPKYQKKAEFSALFSSFSCIGHWNLFVIW